MQEHHYPENESIRIDTLRSLNILDTLSEQRFACLTKLAKRLFAVPIALVSLIDVNRQWFKSCIGMEIKETAENISFCGHTILENEILMIPDTTLDERFYDNPLVIDEPKIRFYAGVPLAVANGSNVGTLCLIDSQPRTLTDEEKELLWDLGHLAEQELATIHLATIDELTQISNRRGFKTLSTHALNLCKRLNRAASLFFFDLDLFKEINDLYGHAEGDRALIGFSKILQETFRESDVIGRLGGDEFVALLTNTNRNDGQLILKRLDQVRTTFNQREARGYDILCSVGMVEFDPQYHKSIDDLLQDGDRLMYAQKQMKRQSIR